MPGGGFYFPACMLADTTSVCPYHMLEAEADSVLPPVYCHLKKGREAVSSKGHNLKVAHITSSKKHETVQWLVKLQSRPEG